MKLQPNNILKYSIKQYDDKTKTIKINANEYNQSLIIYNQVQIIDIDDIHLLAFHHLQFLLEQKPEVLIIGTGKQQIFLPQTLYSDFINQNIGVEFMSNSTACGTYNVLLAEGRKAALIIIL